MIAAVDHVQPAAPPGSEPDPRAYRVGVPGMTEPAKPPVLASRGGCWSGAGAAVPHLGVEEDFRPARKARPGIRVTGIHEFAERLRRAARRSPGTTTCRATSGSTPRTRSATGWSSCSRR